MRKIFGFLLGAVVGGLIGSTVALLLAPDSGELLRNRIHERGDAFFAEIRQAADTRRIELQDHLETLRAPSAKE